MSVSGYLASRMLFSSFCVRHTSLSGTNGGPTAMSADLVPGCILLEELASICDCSISVVANVAAGPPDGEFGPIWFSAGGGGLGKRGELGARDMMEEEVRPQLSRC